MAMGVGQVARTVAAMNNTYFGLLRPIPFPFTTFLVGMEYLPETKDTKTREEVIPSAARNGGAAPVPGGADVGTTMH